MKKRIIKKPDVRKAEIIAAAERLFQQYGYESTPVDVIIKEAGIAKGTFYYYFKTKKDILRALVELICSDLEAHFTAIAKKKNNDNSKEIKFEAIANKPGENVAVNIGTCNSNDLKTQKKALSENFAAFNAMLKSGGTYRFAATSTVENSSSKVRAFCIGPDTSTQKDQSKFGKNIQRINQASDTSDKTIYAVDKSIYYKSIYNPRFYKHELCIESFDKSEVINSLTNSAHYFITENEALKYMMLKRNEGFMTFPVFKVNVKSSIKKDAVFEVTKVVSATLFTGDNPDKQFFGLNAFSMPLNFLIHSSQPLNNKNENVLHKSLICTPANFSGYYKLNPVRQALTFLLCNNKLIMDTKNIGLPQDVAQIVCRNMLK